MTPCVLVVDDDPVVRQSIRRVLEAEHYEVYSAADADEAEQLDPRGVNVLLLDINLPLRSGWGTFERLTARNPFMTVIIAAGQDQQVQAGTVAGAAASLEKPLDVAALLATIRDELARPRVTRVLRQAGGPGGPGGAREPRWAAPDAWQVFEALRARCERPFQFELPVRCGDGGRAAPAR